MLKKNKKYEKIYKKCLTNCNQCDIMNIPRIGVYFFVRFLSVCIPLIIAAKGGIL